MFGPNAPPLAAQLPATDADPAYQTAAEMRARIRERFAELRAERQQLQDQLDALDATNPHAADFTFLGELPLVGDILPGLPPRLKARLFQAVNLTILWNKPGNQATVWADITEATLRPLPAILNPARTDTTTPPPTSPNLWGSTQYR